MRLTTDVRKGCPDLYGGSEKGVTPGRTTVVSVHPTSEKRYVSGTLRPLVPKKKDEETLESRLVVRIKFDYELPASDLLIERC